MVTGKDNNQINVERRGKCLEQVDSLKYIGVNINIKGSDDIEINSRIGNETKVYYSAENLFSWKETDLYKN